MPKLFQYLCLLMLIPASAFSQELKSVKQRHGDLYLEYYVQAKSPKVREGLYREFTTFGSRRLVEEGFYKNGMKDSLWTYFDIQGDTTEMGTFSADLKNGYWKKWTYSPSAGRILTDEGNYKDGKRVGLWVFRKPTDSLYHKYDYTANKVIEYGKSDGALTIVDGKDTISAIMEKPPVHIGGMDTLYMSLAMNIRMPAELKRNINLVFHYRTFVSFIINENGKLTNYAIARGNNAACNEEAIRVMKLWDDGNWAPGYYNEHAVKVVMMIPVTFNLNTTGNGPPPPANTPTAN